MGIYIVNVAIIILSFSVAIDKTGYRQIDIRETRVKKEIGDKQNRAINLK